jgi:hypothetical protein
MVSRIIATKVANALVEDAELALPELPGLDVLAPYVRSVERVLATFKRAYGGLWVGGRATLTTSDIRFRPNAVNRSIQTGSLDIVVPLPAVEDVQVLRGFVTRIIAIHTPGFVVKVRCFGADAFADKIRSAANDARGAG